MGDPSRVDVLGVGISAIDMNGAVTAVTRFIAENRREYVCVTGVHGVMESQRDSRLLDIHNRSGLTTPDGMPMVWAGRWAGLDSIKRVYGPDLMLELCRVGVSQDWRHFFYGGKEGVAAELAAGLVASIPGLKVVGVHSPPFRALTETEMELDAKAINDTGADIVWVGLSTPKQEYWMASMRPMLHAPVLIGVGAAFDIHSGNSRQAPSWMQRSGLEWLFRLVTEPKRLWRRYLRNNPAFVWHILWRKPRVYRAF